MEIQDSMINGKAFQEVLESEIYKKELIENDFKHKVGLCKGRHNLPVSIFIYDEEISNPLDFEGLELEAKKKLLLLFPQHIKHCVLMGINDDKWEEYSSPHRGFIDLYVTGLTTALIAVINACQQLDVQVVLYHYHRDDNSYHSQNVY